MKKKPIIFLIISILITSFNINAQVVKGNGILKEDIRELKGFTQVIAEGRFKLFLIQGETEQIRIETDSNLAEYFQTKLEGEILHIRMNADIRKFKELNVYVSIKNLTSVSILNEIYLESENVIQFEEISICSGGMSQIDMELFAKKLNMELTDGTYARLKGYTEHLDIKIHDETEFDGFELQADYCKVRSSGLTDVMINAEKDLKLMVTGSSNVYYIGEPKISERIFTSSGFIVKRKKGKVVKAGTGN